MASALPVGSSARSRSWAALWQAPACQYLSICGTELRAQGRVENSIRVGSVGRGYFETRWPQFVPPESADQAIAKVLPFPAPTDCKSAAECVPRDNWFEGAQIKITPPNRTLFHF
jgi:hypothetical protein